MVHPVTDGPARSDEMDREAQWRSAGDRIQTLLDASSTGGAVARERAEQLVREVVEVLRKHWSAPAVMR